MKQTIHVSIDSNGRAKASSKNLGNQYETGVAEFEIDLSSDWQDESYFYYLVVIPPESTGIKQYAVPLTKDFVYLISSNITWYLGTFKFLIIVMNKELDESGQIPTDGVVSISDEWEGEVNKSPLKLAELAEQPENPNFTLLYTDLMALRNSVEQASNYAQTQGDYAKSVGEQLLLDKENGVFNGKDGEKGEKGDTGPQGDNGNDGYSPTVAVKTNTSTQYVLEITYKDETGNTQTLVTPNLKGKDGEEGGGGGTPGNVPTKLSELENDTGFITNTVNNLVNYYLKTEVYKKDEVNNLINNLTSFSAVIVTSLPTQDISTTTIYLIANTEQAENNYYDEYLYINSAWEKIGTTQTKLDNYFTKDEVATLLSKKISEPLTEGMNGQVLVTDGNGGRTWRNIEATIMQALQDVLFEGEFTTIGALSEKNFLSDNVFNYDVVYLTTYQKTNGVAYRLNTIAIDTSTLRVITNAYPLWISSVYYGDYGYYLAGNFGDGTQLCISETLIGKEVAAREHGICRVTGVRYTDISTFVTETLGGAY